MRLVSCFLFFFFKRFRQKGQDKCCSIQEVDTKNPSEDEEQVEEEQVEELDLTGLDDAELDKVWVLFIVYS